MVCVPLIFQAMDIGKSSADMEKRKPKSAPINILVWSRYQRINYHMHYILLFGELFRLVNRLEIKHIASSFPWGGREKPDYSGAGGRCIKPQNRRNTRENPERMKRGLGWREWPKSCLPQVGPGVPNTMNMQWNLVPQFLVTLSH